MADGLRRLDGVANVEVDLQANVCTVTPTPDRLPDLAGFPAAVHAAGYRPARMWVQVVGTASAAPDGGRQFQIQGSPLWVRLVGDGDVTKAFVVRLEHAPQLTFVPDRAPR